MPVLVSLLLLVIVISVIWGVSDYRAWKALGKGGVPDNWRGWLMVTRFRLAKREPFGTAIYAERIGGAEDSVHLGNLPACQGTRPRIGVHPVPHRQLDQPGSPEALQQLAQLFDSFVAENGKHVCYAKSFYEKRNDAIMLNSADKGHALAKVSHGEVAHIHPADGSMHMIFSPSDAKQVIEKDWGERHPLAGATGFNLPDTYLMIYSPRNTQEVTVISQLLRAAVQHMCICDCRDGKIVGQ